MDSNSSTVYLLLTSVVNIYGVARGTRHRMDARCPVIIPYFTGEYLLASNDRYYLQVHVWLNFSSSFLTNVREVRATVRRDVPYTTAWDYMLRFGPTNARHHGIGLKDMVFGMNLMSALFAQCSSHLKILRRKFIRWHNAFPPSLILRMLPAFTFTFNRQTMTGFCRNLGDISQRSMTCHKTTKQSLLSV
jgi:hypothetical protein